MGFEPGAGEGGLEQGFSVRGRRQAKIDWHQRARAVLLLSPLLFYEFSIKRSSSAPALRAARASALLTGLPYCHLASVENTHIYIYFFLRCCYCIAFQACKNCVLRLSCSAAQVFIQNVSQAAVDLQLFLILELKYFCSQNVPA